MDAILEQFLSEARDNLSYLDKHLADLENGDEETLNALFRAAHTLKGGAGLVGLEAIKEITHVAEDLFDAYRKHEVQYSQELLDTLYEAFDEVIELVDASEEIGGTGVEFDLEKINEIKNDIKSFLSPKEAENTEEKVETNLNIVSNMSVAELFTDLESSKIISENHIFERPAITNSFLQSEQLWVVDIDIDIDTVKLGNDPVYMLYLLGEDKVKTISVSLANCDELDSDVLNWFTRIVAIVETNSETFEDAFYNVLDEVTLTPLTIDLFFDSSYENSENSAVDDFKEELLALVKEQNFTMLDEKLSAITSILNPKSKEGFVLSRLQAILSSFEIGSTEYINTLEIAMEKLDIELPKCEIEQKTETAPASIPFEEKDSSEKKSVSQKEMDTALNILKTQLKVIKNSQNDKTLVDRTRLLISHVLSSVGFEEDLSSIDSVESIENYIKSKIADIQGKDEEISVTKKEVVEPQIEKKKEIVNPVKNVAKKSIARTIKIDQEEITHLMDIVGELLVMKNALPYIANHIKSDRVDESKREISTKYEEISRVTDRLQDIVMGMRLLPLSFIFDRYPKLVRDISKKLGKKIEYIEEGGETKLDKMMIEKLADPLIHIIRNSLDHGLENEADRLEAGKNPIGKLKISASSQGDRVLITISDDGRGINLNAVINKALEKRLVEPDMLDKMSREEQLMLIFEPGLSTNEVVTDLSGRGVGTDALKTVIEQLSGKIKLESIDGQGTTTTLELPVSVALTNVFHIKMNHTNYAIDMDYIVETQKVNKEELQYANHKPFFRMRGELVPLIFEEKLMGTRDIDDVIPVVVIESKNGRFGLMIDEFVGQLDVVQKPLPGALHKHPFISGTSLLGSGDVLFVLDPSKIIV